MRPAGGKSADRISQPVVGAVIVGAHPMAEGHLAPAMAVTMAAMREPDNWRSELRSRNPVHQPPHPSAVPIRSGLIVTRKKGRVVEVQTYFWALQSRFAAGVPAEVIVTQDGYS